MGKRCRLETVFYSIHSGFPSTRLAGTPRAGPKSVLDRCTHAPFHLVRFGGGNESDMSRSGDCRDVVSDLSCSPNLHSPTKKETKVLLGHCYDSVGDE